MSPKSREVIFGSQIRGAKIRAERARERAKQAVREADRAEAEAWSIRMELRRPGNRTEGHRRAHNSECQGQQRYRRDQLSHEAIRHAWSPPETTSSYV